jgi:hypothetical protein
MVDHIGKIPRIDTHDSNQMGVIKRASNLLKGYKDERRKSSD